MTVLDDRITEMYRFFDGSDCLLYVGISKSTIARMAEHQVDKNWWGSVMRIEISRYPDRTAALEAEADAIFYEEPLYNLARPSWEVDEYGCRIYPNEGLTEPSRGLSGHSVTSRARPITADDTRRWEEIVVTARERRAARKTIDA